jgi:aconitate hydratase
MHIIKKKFKNQLTGAYDAVPAVARAYKAAGVPVVVVRS